MQRVISINNSILLCLFIAVSVFLSSCGGGSDPAPTNPSADDDNDGLSNGDELTLYKTSPQLSDTDGDGYSDFRELKELGFDASVDNARFNPLIADLPRLDINIQTTPIIGMKYSDTNSEVITTATTRGRVDSTTSSTSIGGSVTIGVESTATVGGEVSTTGASASASSSLSVSTEATVSFDATTTQENQTTWEKMQQTGIETSTNVEGGFMRIGVVLANAGHIPFTIQHISLAAKRANSENPFTPLGTLDYTSTAQFKPTSLGKGVATGALTFENADLDLGTVRNILTNTRSITVEPGIFELTREDGQPFAYTEFEVTSRTAKILIDYDARLPSELYQVATNNIPGSPGKTLAEILSDFLKISYTAPDGSLLSINGVAKSSTTDGRWVVNSVRKTGTRVTHKLYDTSYSISDISVKAGDEISLVYLEDADGDTLGRREELLHGTDPSKKDTDGDGIDDNVEIREPWTVNAVNAKDPARYRVDVYSSPVYADYDKDTVDDAAEKNRGLDPNNADTDGDGIRDDVDTIIDGANPVASSLRIKMVDENTVVISGSLVAVSPQVISSASIDWGDGSTLETFGTIIGANSTLTIAPVTHDYTVGEYTLTLLAADDFSPTVNTLTETASVKVTASARIEKDFSFDAQYRVATHIRKLADIDGDGKDDIIAFANSATVVALSNGSGFDKYTVWSNEWHKGEYPTVLSTPRFLVDLDADGDLDIVGIKATSTQSHEVRYSLNNGSGFDASVSWISDLTWNWARDSVFFQDVDNNGYPDIVHAGVSNKIDVYLSQSASLNLSTPVSDKMAWDTGYPNKAKYPIEMADLDGDNCVDMVLFGETYVSYLQSRCDGGFNSDGKWINIFAGYVYSGKWRVDLHKRFVTDINNDGRPDIVGFSNSNIVVMINNSSGASNGINGTIRFISPIVWSEGFFTTGSGWKDNGVSSKGIYPRYLADVNNDGYKDIVGFAVGGVRIGLNDKNRFLPEIFWGGTFNLSSNEWWNGASPKQYFPRMVGDFNGDGRADMLGFGRSGVTYQAMSKLTQFQ